MSLSQETADSIAGGIGTVKPFVAAINPIIPLVLTIVQQAIKAEPKIESALKALFSKPDLKPEDFDAAIAHIEATTYAQLVPHSDLPK